MEATNSTRWGQHEQFENADEVVPVFRDEGLRIWPARPCQSSDEEQQCYCYLAPDSRLFLRDPPWRTVRELVQQSYALGSYFALLAGSTLSMVGFIEMWETIGKPKSPRPLLARSS